MLQEGRGSCYLEKRDWKRMEMEAKSEKLKESGGNHMVNKALAKKRKKKGGGNMLLLLLLPWPHQLLLQPLW